MQYGAKDSFFLLGYPLSRERRSICRQHLVAKTPSRLSRRQRPAHFWRRDEVDERFPFSRTGGPVW